MNVKEAVDTAIKVFLGGKIVVLVLVFVSLVVGISFYAIDGTPDNIETEVASDIIQYETGINLEKILQDRKAKEDALKKPFN
jgi:hypothetical protein